MAPREMSTYFPYNEGHDPKLLRLGTLVLDYANPRVKRPYYHGDVAGLLDEPPMATEDRRSYCSMSQTVSRNSSFGFGLEGLFGFDYSRAGGSHRVVIGKNGSKLELIDANKFFRQNILSEDAARLWLETRLSVASKFRAWWQNTRKAPEIWLLTGIYLMEDAVTYTVSATSASGSVSSSIPIPEPTGLAELLGVAVGAKFAVGSGFEAQANAQIQGQKIWAAQWTPVSVKYLCITHSEWSANKLQSQIQLLDTQDIGNVRSDDVNLAEVSLRTDVEEVDDVVGESTLDEDRWAEFEKSLDQLLGDLLEDV